MIEQIPANPWNSLEILKLIFSTLTPMLIVIIGLFLNQKLKKFEHVQWRNQKLIEKRLIIFDEITPLLNDLLCYFTYVGYWKECKPTEIIKLKRILDKKIYLAKPLFSDDFFIKSLFFVDLCYKPYQGWGEDAKLLTDFNQRKKAFSNEWDEKWDNYFANNSNEITNSTQLRKSYYEIMEILSKDIGIS